MVKVLVIGLDGATWDIIMPAIDEGILPTFKKLISRGSYGPLISTIPPYTVPAWISCTTGKKPGRLGISGLVQKVPGTYEFKPFFFIVKEKKHHIWDILSDNGFDVVVANVPSVTEAWRVKGVMVAGEFMNVNREKKSYPKDLKHEIKRAVKAPVYKPGEVKESSTFKEILKKMATKKSRIFQYLLSTYSWDFGFIVFTESDRIQHKCWENKDYILEVYQQLDTEIANLLKIIDKDTIVFFVSDHGFGESKYDFNLNVWLQKQGYLNLTKKKKNEKNLLLRITSTLLYEYNLKKYVEPVVSRLPFGIQKSAVQKVVPREIKASDVDWSSTRAFSKSGFGEVYLNVSGREPKGIIKPGEEYEHLRNEIIGRLKELRDPNNNKVNPTIFKKEEIFGNYNINQPPDLLIHTNDNVPSISARVGINKIFSKGPISGNHRLNGLFLAFGPGIKKNNKMKAKILNITPTILHIYNLPLNDDMDGNVMFDVFDEKSEFRSREVKYKKGKGEKYLLKDGIKKFISDKKI